MPSYDASQLIASLPSDYKVTLTTSGGESATVARASISNEIVNTMYGEDAQYDSSYYLDSNDFTTLPAAHERVTVDGQTLLVLGVRRYGGDLRIIDVGGKYG